MAITKRMVNKKSVGLIGAIVLIGVVVYLLPTEQGQAPPLSVRVAVSTTPLSAPLYIAAQRGFFRQCGLDVMLEDFVGGKRSFQQILDGNADLATSSDSVVAFSAFEHDFRVLFSFASSDHDVKIVHRRGLDLANDPSLKIGYIAGSASEYFLQIYDGLSLIHKDAERIALAPEPLLQALIAGEVDAMVNWEPFGWLASKASGTDFVVADSKNLYSLHFDLISRSDFLAANPQIGQRFSDALTLATLYVHEYPEEAKKILVDRLKVEPEFIDWIWGDYFFAVSPAIELLHSYTSGAAWFIKQGIVEQTEVPDFTSLIAPTVHLLADRDSKSIMERCDF